MIVIDLNTKKVIYSTTDCTRHIIYSTTKNWDKYRIEVALWYRELERKLLYDM